MVVAWLIIAPFVLKAQEVGTQSFNPEVFRTCSIIFLIGMFMFLFLAILKKVFEFRLKNKIIDKGIPEHIIGSILQSNPNEDRNSYVKWGVIVAGIGIGLTLVNYTLPLGIHSLAILAFCLSASFVAYYFLMRKLEK